MANQLFHIFRNNPQGRETLLQSLYFCKTIEASLVIYISKHKKLLMDFESGSVQIDLDKSYFTSTETAVKHAGELVEEMGVTAEFLELKNYSNAKLPNIKPEFDFMCCPSCISDRPSKIGAGQIGPKVIQIVNVAHFPVLLTKPAFKEWQSIAIFLIGSSNDVNALDLGLHISSVSDFSADVFVFNKNCSLEPCETDIETYKLAKEMNCRVAKWHYFENRSFEEHLYQVPHNALVVLGASDHIRLKNIVWGTWMGRIYSELPNNILIAGPNCAQ